MDSDPDGFAGGNFPVVKERAFGCPSGNFTLRLCNRRPLQGRRPQRGAAGSAWPKRGKGEPALRGPSPEARRRFFHAEHPHSDVWLIPLEEIERVIDAPYP